MTPKKGQNKPDSTLRKSKKLQRVICQRLLNFIFNISRRSVAILENQLGNLQKNLEKDVVGMNVLQAIVLYGVTVSSYN